VEAEFTGGVAIKAAVSEQTDLGNGKPPGTEPRAESCGRWGNENEDGRVGGEDRRCVVAWDTVEIAAVGNAGGIDSPAIAPNMDRLILGNALADEEPFESLAGVSLGKINAKNVAAWLAAEKLGVNAG
jgi:hypothetical protein